MKMTNLGYSVAVSITMLSLAGCGGESGSGPSGSGQTPDPIAIAGEEAAVVAYAAVSTPVDIADAATADQVVNYVQNLNTSDLYFVMEATNFWVDTSASTAVDTLCGGGVGTMVGTIDRADPISLNSGDYFSLAFTDCTNDTNRLINGRVSLNLDLYNFNYYGTRMMRVGAEGLVFHSAGLNGPIHEGTFNGGYSEYEYFNVDTVTTHPDPNTTVIHYYYQYDYQLNGSALSINSPNADLLLQNFSFTRSYDTTAGSESVNYSFVVASPAIGGSVQVRNVTPFSGTYGQPPIEGQMVITANNNVKIRVTALGIDQVTLSYMARVEYDFNGDGIYEQSVDKNWSAL